VHQRKLQGLSRGCAERVHDHDGYRNRTFLIRDKPHVLYSRRRITFILPDKTHNRSRVIENVRSLANEVAPRAHVPYSGRDEAAVLLLSDGSWIPGVRVESASFSLLIPAIVNAVTTAVACGRLDIVAVVQSRIFLPTEILYLQDGPHERLYQVDADAYARKDRELPIPQSAFDPFLDIAKMRTRNAENAILAARAVAMNAYVPESHFPVGCIVETEEGAWVPAVNVENIDWNRVLCAERNALGTTVSYALGPIRSVYLTCLRDPKGTSCGACRQLLSELAPRSTLWMDRGEDSPESSDPLTLLPGSFTGSSIQKRSR